MRIRIIRPAAGEFRPLTADEQEEHHQQGQRYASPGTEIEEVRVLKGAQTIESLYDVEMAAPCVLQLVEQAARDRVDGIIICCMLDPALLAARELVDVPVMGTGLASCITALALGDRFSVVSPTDTTPAVRSMLRVYGLEQHLACVRSIELPVVDLREDQEVLRDAMLQKGERAVEEDGAQVIVPSCGEIYGLAEDLTAALGVPVLDPRAVVMGFTEMLIGASLTHSKRAYLRPSEKRREL